MSKYFDELSLKFQEFQRCAAHLHMRGAHDVVNECRPLIDEAKKDGKTFDDFFHYVVLQEYWPQKDEILSKNAFLRLVKDIYAS